MSVVYHEPPPPITRALNAPSPRCGSISDLRSISSCKFEALAPFASGPRRTSNHPTSTSFSVRIPGATTSSDTPSCIGVADAQASRAGQSFSGLVCGNLCTLCGRASCFFGISCASWNTRSMDHCRIREHRSRDRGYSRIIAVDHDRWMRVISGIRRFTSVRVLAE